MDGARLAVMRHELSAKRPRESSVRVFALGVGPGIFSAPQPAGWDHLVTTRTGTMVLRCFDCATTIAPAVAVRVAAERAYALDIRSRSDLRIVLTPASSSPTRPTRAFAMTPLLRECVERAVTAGYLDPKSERHARVLAVIADELAALREAPSAAILAIPRDPMLRAAIERFLARDGEPASIAEIASAAHVSVRTFERHFLAETGLTPREWLRRARLARATIALENGATVTEAGLAHGYASTSAFIFAYRSLFGVTPGRFDERVRSESKKTS